MKYFLYLFENMSDLKINFNKSEVIMVSEDVEKSIFYSEMFNCATGQAYKIFWGDSLWFKTTCYGLGTPC